MQNSDHTSTFKKKIEKQQKKTQLLEQQIQQLEDEIQKKDEMIKKTSDSIMKKMKDFILRRPKNLDLEAKRKKIKTEKALLQKDVKIAQAEEKKYRYNKVKKLKKQQKIADEIKSENFTLEDLKNSKTLEKIQTEMNDITKKVQDAGGQSKISKDYKNKAKEIQNLDSKRAELEKLDTELKKLLGPVKRQAPLGASQFSQLDMNNAQNSQLNAGKAQEEQFDNQSKISSLQISQFDMSKAQSFQLSADNLQKSQRSAVQKQNSAPSAIAQGQEMEIQNLSQEAIQKEAIQQKFDTLDKEIQELAKIKELYELSQREKQLKTVQTAIEKYIKLEEEKATLKARYKQSKPQQQEQQIQEESQIQQEQQSRRTSELSQKSRVSQNRKSTLVEISDEEAEQLLKKRNPKSQQKKQLQRAKSEIQPQSKIQQLQKEDQSQVLPQRSLSQSATQQQKEQLQQEQQQQEKQLQQSLSQPLSEIQQEKQLRESKSEIQQEKQEEQLQQEQPQLKRGTTMDDYARKVIETIGPSRYSPSFEKFCTRENMDYIIKVLKKDGKFNSLSDAEKNESIINVGVTLAAQAAINSNGLKGNAADLSRDDQIALLEYMRGKGICTQILSSPEQLERAVKYDPYEVLDKKDRDRPNFLSKAILKTDAKERINEDTSGKKFAAYIAGYIALGPLGLLIAIIFAKYYLSKAKRREGKDIRALLDAKQNYRPAPEGNSTQKNSQALQQDVNNIKSENTVLGQKTKDQVQNELHELLQNKQFTSSELLKQAMQAIKIAEKIQKYDTENPNSFEARKLAKPLEELIAELVQKGRERLKRGTDDDGALRLTESEIAQDKISQKKLDEIEAQVNNLVQKKEIPSQIRNEESDFLNKSSNSIIVNQSRLSERFSLDLNEISAIQKGEGEILAKDTNSRNNSIIKILEGMNLPNAVNRSQSVDISKTSSHGSNDKFRHHS
ncbi:hypothetical protein Fsol_00609 [Candidatus Fokinia solitaria]|uniref:Transmembrane protein n=1 Tax=Candidatus Fokinia solitaria TaxID=1802984 RepID=A0A2U8BSS2_9RICK|nr:hypothetical protein [Candidatus Fokinia solitaria]AWD33391.1 hypothetical protein Fsol_00609 [Candidatus Fokinia solitaria]